MTPYWTSPDGRHVLYCGDCLEILPTLPKVDALVTDPPYGIAYEASRYANASFAGVLENDAAEFNPGVLIALDIPAVIWGGNNFAHLLPPGGWLCWDKRTNEEADKIFGSPFELAWCSIRTRFKIIRCLHGAAVNADGPFPRVHPTQKPLRVMEWSVKQLGDAALILDPYMGSGTTGVACIKLGRKFIGIEISEAYVKIAVERMERELSQPRLPGLEPSKAEQGMMFRGQP